MPSIRLSLQFGDRKTKGHIDYSRSPLLTQDSIFIWYKGLTENPTTNYIGKFQSLRVLKNVGYIIKRVSSVATRRGSPDFDAS